MSAETAAKARLLASMHAPGERVKTRVRSGLGVELTLEDSRVVLDAGSMSSCLLGHCHPEVVAAVEKAARTVYVGDATGYAPRERAADDMLRLGLGGGPVARHRGVLLRQRQRRRSRTPPRANAPRTRAAGKP